MIDRQQWQQKLRQWILVNCAGDPAHDLKHIERVVANATSIARDEQADLNILLPAAWLHDCIHVPKNSPDRAKASLFAADQAVSLLREESYPTKYLDAIHHAIVAHSFSAKQTPQTLEAKVLQDADRLDALGAFGLSRCLMLGGHMDQTLLCADDPFCKSRKADDSLYVIDHFYAKLLTLEDTMTTASGKQLAQKRSEFLRIFLRTLEEEMPNGDWDTP